MLKKTSLLAMLCCLLASIPAQSQDSFIGEIKMFAGNFAPVGWELCDGRLLAISSNQALFSILGTTYGGDGRTTFGLPDLRGRVPLGQGSGIGLVTRRLGEKSGEESTTLTPSQLPTHIHSMPVVEMHPDEPEHRFQKGSAAVISVGNSANQRVSTQNSGSGQSVNNMQPYLAINFIICTNGVYPSRN